MSLDVTSRTQPLGTAAAPGTSFWTATRLIAEREIRTMVRTKGYWVLLGLFVVGIFAGSVLPGLIGGGPTTVATVGPQAAELATEAGFEVESYPDRSAAEQSVRDEEVEFALVPDPAADSQLGVTVVALSEEPGSDLLALSVAPPVDLLEPADVTGPAQYLIPVAFGLVFLVFGAGFGAGIAQSVVIEKQTRIVEILVATIPVRALLAGKIIGHSLLALGQIAVIALVAPLAMRAGDRGDLLSVVAPALGWFIPFFILGFVLLAAMWATAGALVSRQEDLGTTTPVVSMLVMIPYFGVAFFQDNPLVMSILSYVPFSAAVAMPVRLFTGDAQIWEPYLSMLLLVAATVVVVLVASRLYSGSLLQTSGRLKLRQAWSSAEK